MDPLSDILTMLTVSRAVPLRFESSGRYAMRFTSYEHLKIGAVLSGHMRLRVEGWPALHLQAGDCYLLTDGRPYRTDNGEDVDEFDGTAFFAAHRSADGVVRLGEGPPDKVVIAGRFIFDHVGVGWLREALPPAIHVKAGTPEAAPLRDTLALLAREAGGGAPGEAVVVGRLADILLVQAIRAHLAAAGPEKASWLSGLADPRIGRALRHFHADVATPWTVASLAAKAGMSRSSFAERFRMRVGLPPLDYLTRWRMVRVRQALTETDLPFGQIAESNGYLSRSSCSQAFRRAYGHPPAQLRAAARLARAEPMAPSETR